MKLGNALTPALSHSMGEGESSAAVLKFHAAVVAGRSYAELQVSDGCSPLPSDGRGVRGEGYALRNLGIEL